MDEEKINKQNLLKSEIIDNSYDQKEFIEFCMQQKKEGDDLDNWTYDELKNIIKEFTKKINHEIIQENKEKDNNKEKDAINKESLKEEKQEDNTENNLENNNNEIEINNNEEEIIKIYCKELKKNILNDKKIYVNVQKEMTVSNNSHIVYEIITSNRQKESKDKIYYKVQRKYSDFIQFRELLLKYNPYNYIPSLPEKSEKLIKENEQEIISYLNIFINAIILKEEFKAFEGTFLFLTIENYDEYKNKIKEISLMQNPLNVNQLCDFNKYKIFPYLNENDYNNEIMIEENKNELYFFNIKNYFEIQFKLISKLKSHLNEFNDNFINCCNILDNIQQDYIYLCQLNKKVMMKDNIEKSFEEMGLFFKGWKELINKQNILVQKNINAFYKFCINEELAYLSLIKTRENIKNLYINEYKKLDNKKEKMWKFEDIKKWGINYELKLNYEIDNVKLLKDKKYAKKKMLHKESQELEIIKNNFGYINYMNKEELQPFLDNYLIGFKIFISNFVKEFYPTLNDFINSWSNLSIFVN